VSEILYRGAGRFVTMRGSDQIVQFYELPEHMLRSSSDLHEILLYRSFRRALRDDQVQELSVEALSFYFYAATFLHEALARQEGAPVRVIHHNEELGLLCEGLKLVTALRKIDWDIEYRGLFTNTTDEDGFDILHVLCDSLPSTVRIVGAKGSEEMPVDSDRVTKCLGLFQDAQRGFVPDDGRFERLRGPRRTGLRHRARHERRGKNRHRRLRTGIRAAIP
jgi:hypothetical protein